MLLALSGCIKKDAGIVSILASIYGSGDWIRTNDRSGMNRLLWPTELHRHSMGIISAGEATVKGFSQKGTKKVCDVNWPGSFEATEKRLVCVWQTSEPEPAERMQRRPPNAAHRSGLLPSLGGLFTFCYLSGIILQYIVGRQHREEHPCGYWF